MPQNAQLVRRGDSGVDSGVFFPIRTHPSYSSMTGEYAWQCLHQSWTVWVGGGMSTYMGWATGSRAMMDAMNQGPKGSIAHRGNPTCLRHSAGYLVSAPSDKHLSRSSETACL